MRRVIESRAGRQMHFRPSKLHWWRVESAPSMHSHFPAHSLTHTHADQSDPYLFFWHHVYLSICDSEQKTLHFMPFCCWYASRHMFLIVSGCRDRQHEQEKIWRRWWRMERYSVQSQTAMFCTRFSSPFAYTVWFCLPALHA